MTDWSVWALFLLSEHCFCCLGIVSVTGWSVWALFLWQTDQWALFLLSEHCFCDRLISLSIVSVTDWSVWALFLWQTDQSEHCFCDRQTSLSIVSVTDWPVWASFLWQTDQSEHCFCDRLPVPPVGVNRASEKEFSPVLSDQCQPLVTIMSDERYDYSLDNIGLGISMFFWQGSNPRAYLQARCTEGIHLCHCLEQSYKFHAFYFVCFCFMRSQSRSFSLHLCCFVWLVVAPTISFLSEKNEAFALNFLGLKVGSWQSHQITIYFIADLSTIWCQQFWLAYLLTRLSFTSGHASNINCLINS